MKIRSKELRARSQTHLQRARRLLIRAVHECDQPWNIFNDNQQHRTTSVTPCRPGPFVRRLHSGRQALRGICRNISRSLTAPRGTKIGIPNNFGGIRGVFPFCALQRSCGRQSRRSYATSRRTSARKPPCRRPANFDCLHSFKENRRRPAPSREA